MAYKGKRINPQKFERGQIKIMIILLPLLIFMAMPLVYIANHAFKPMDELFAFPPTFFVKNATLENFEKLIKFSRTSGVPMSRYVFNSLIVTVLTVGLSLLFTTMSAFALAKLKFKGRDMMMNVNQMALMFVATAVLIPRYLVIAKLGLIDNIWATRKDENLNGLKLLVIQPINLIDLHPVGEPIIAADIIGAGVGETVIYVGGSSARPAAGGSNIPVDATIVGIVDGHDVDVALI